MARTATRVNIGKRKIELSNLQKVLFPSDNIIKAELIEYYHRIVPTLIKHVKGRPLSLVRFPDGVDGESFFQKNRPEWAPSWLDHVALGDQDKVDYVIANEEATLVWLANLACIECHQMHSRQPHLDKPDYIVFDIDPPPNTPFTHIVDIAFDLKAHIETYGYHTFVKTTGGKGVHIVTPIEAKWGFDQIHETAVSIAKPFIESHSSTTTLHVKKELRQGKTFIDIHRNRTYQTIVSAYSVRGRDGAPVSMPLHWEELQGLTEQTQFNLHTAVDKVIRDGDAWETIGAYAVSLHTERKQVAVRKRKSPKGSDKPAESLSEYARKRSFDKTPEPAPAPDAGTGDSFVIHRHHASRLHYDVRLEQNGALKSFAVPKGVPPRPGIKRMAVNTEDHPLRYLEFEGVIPKGQYGAGNMWVFARGRYEVTKEKKEGFYFRTTSRELNAEYRMIHTKEKDWLMERVDQPQVDWLRDPIEPMLAQIREEPFDSDDYLFEIKWDGIRAMIALDEGEITIRSRSQRIVTKHYPELLKPAEAFRATSALFDGEIVCLDDGGRPIFENSVRRLQQSSEGAIARVAAKHPAVCYLFDCLYLDGRPITSEPLWRRREWLADSVRKNDVYRVSEVVNEGVLLFGAASEMGLEGIVAKERNSVYTPGRRTDSWLKIKSHRTTEGVILGYTRGEGDRAQYFGAVQLGKYDGETLRYIGKAGGGFDQRTLREVHTSLKKFKPVPRYIKEKPLDDAQTTWITPELVCEVRYSSLTKDAILREPVFLRMRPDLKPGDVH